ncbi:S26 family signal peptidase [archaeon SCG-AAA382B04]|nr:S26 family signal peptidase [archaeon SCG-AAA382B04]
MGKIKNFFTKDKPWYLAFLRDFILSLLVLGIILGGIYLYSGVWPPLVAVESESMKPNIEIGDVVFIVEDEITTYQQATKTGLTSFNRPGNVVVYDVPGKNGKPIIHRAMYWVKKGEEMWGEGPEAPHSGYITKGDNNDVIDQKSPDIAYGEPIKKEWIQGKAKYKIPLIGKLRLFLDNLTGGIVHYTLETQYQYTHQQLQWIPSQCFS